MRSIASDSSSVSRRSSVSSHISPLFDESHDQPSVVRHPGDDGEAGAADVPNDLRASAVQRAVRFAPSDLSCSQGVIAVIVVDVLPLHTSVYHL
jgi:hypothetical protein